MANSFFSFKEFTINQEKAAFKVGTDGVLLGAAADLKGALNILDAGTGSGLLAIMCAQRSGAIVTAIEPDNGSFQQAVENVSACRWSGRIKVFESDLQSFIPGNDEKFDLIISNPPYFRDSLLNPDIAKASARHSFSLSSPELISNSLRLLKENGSLQVILPYEEGSMFITEAAMEGLYCNSIIKIRPFPQGKIIRMIMKFERIRKSIHERFLSIETGTRHSYTREYMDLTRDFYLNF